MKACPGLPGDFHPSVAIGLPPAMPLEKYTLPDGFMKIYLQF